MVVHLVKRELPDDLGPSQLCPNEVSNLFLIRVLLAVFTLRVHQTPGHPSSIIVIVLSFPLTAAGTIAWGLVVT